MNHNERNELRRAMEEVAALPPGDPQREQVLRQIEGAGEWAREAWADLLKEDEQRRLTLRHVEVPEDLTQRLKTIPDQVVAQPSSVLRTRHRVVGVAAAACLLLVGLVGLNQVWRDQPDLDRAAQELVRLAVQDHLKRPELTLASSQPHQIESHLQGEVTFPVRVPPMNQQGFVLIGGRVCSFDDQAIAYTRWRDGRREHSLYQFAAADFRLPAEFTPRKVEVPATPEHPQNYEVLIWSSDHCAYVMVCEGQL